MGGAQRLVLIADVPFGAQSLGDGHEFPLDFGTEVADDKADVVHPVVGRTDNVLDQPLDDGLARKGTSGLGTVRVWGRRRLPRPAMGTMMFMLSGGSRVAKPASAPCGLWQLFDGFCEGPCHAFVTCEHELGDAFAVFHGEQGLPVVDQDDPDVAAVVRVDGARAVEDRHPVLVREAASGAHLRFKSTRQGQVQSGGDQGALAWLKHDGSVEFGPEVEACAVGRAVGGQGWGVFATTGTTTPSVVIVSSCSGELRFALFEEGRRALFEVVGGEALTKPFNFHAKSVAAVSSQHAVQCCGQRRRGVRGNFARHHLGRFEQDLLFDDLVDEPARKRGVRIDHASCQDHF